MGEVSNGFHSLPTARVWIDYSAGDDGSGGPSLETVIFRRVPASSFTGLEISPEYEWEISTDRVGYGTASITFKGTGVAGETDWNGTILQSTDGGATWFVPANQTRDSLLHEITLSGQVFPGRYALINPPDDTSPRVTEAVYNDADDDGAVEPGESISLIMDQAVVVNGGLLTQASFFLSVGGDSLGGAGFSASGNPFNARQVDITLGASAAITTAGTFGVDFGASGIDLSASITLSAITSVYGVPALDGGVPGVDDTAFDVVFTAVTTDPPVSVGVSGGDVTVTDSTDAAYTGHTLSISADSLGSPVTFALRPPAESLGVVNAIQVSASDLAVTFDPAATLTLQYRESDFDPELGEREVGMRIHQLVNGAWQLVAGTQTVNPVLDEVEVAIGSLEPVAPSSTPGIFSTLPIAPVVARTITIAPSGGPIRQGTGDATLSLTGGLYPSHEVSFPGFVEVAAGTPGSTQVTIAPAILFDRISTVDGNSFPAQSGALFALSARNASGEPVAFESPVDMTVQFLRPPAGEDVVTLDGQALPVSTMRVARDALDSALVDFRHVEGASQSVTVLGQSGLVEALGMPDLIGPSGRRVWGAAAQPQTGPTTAAGTWALYR